MTMCPPPNSSTGRRLVGYIRGTESVTEDAQVEKLKAAGCHDLVSETAASRMRPVLTKLMVEIAPGDVLVAVRLDRVARSLPDLLSVIEKLAQRGAHFRSLEDPVDTSSSQGALAVKVLASAAKLGRDLISERARLGMSLARSNGRPAGNPGLRERRPEAIHAVSTARQRAYLTELRSSAESWLPIVERMRPQHNWGEIVAVLRSHGQRWTTEKLKRGIRRLVQEQLVNPDLLGRAPRRPPEEALLSLVAGIANSDPSLSLRQIGARLDRMGKRPPRGGRQWAASSVKAHLLRARELGMRAPEPREVD